MIRHTLIKTITIALIGAASAAAAAKWSDDDIDGNDVMTQSEFAVSGLGLRVTFATVDVNEDGLISEDEYRHYARIAQNSGAERTRKET